MNWQAFALVFLSAGELLDIAVNYGEIKVKERSFLYFFFNTLVIYYLIINARWPSVTIAV